jgi:hypothetical protein
VKTRYTTLGQVAAVALVLCATPANAQDIGDAGADAGDGDIGPPLPEGCPEERVGCHTADADWFYRDALFDDIDLDTGWVPAGSPIQVRFGVAIGGSTEIGLGGTVVTSWPPALEVMVPGRPGTGVLRINYGFEILAQVRFDVEVAGVRYEWEGDIPIPFIPEDLRLAGEVAFDPFALPGAEARPVWVEDGTDRVRVLWLDAIDSIIDIPGVGGGFMLTAQAQLETGYQSDRVEVADALPIVGEGETTLVEPPVPTDPDGEEGFGPSVELAIHPEGTLQYLGTLLLVPELYIEVVGTRFDLELFELPLELVDTDGEVIFDDVVVDVPLPDVDVQPARLDLGWAFVGQTSAQPLVFINDGDAALTIVADAEDGVFSADPAALTIEPHRTARVSMRFSPDRAGETSAMFAFSTNDPDEPSLVVLLEGEGRERDLPDAGPTDADPDIGPDGDVDSDAATASPGAGGCDCSVAAASSAK